MKGKYLKKVDWEHSRGYLSLKEAARLAGVYPDSIRTWLMRHGLYRYPYAVFWRGQAMLNRNALEAYLYRGNLVRLPKLYPGWRKLADIAREYPLSYSMVQRAAYRGEFRAGRWRRAIYVEPYSFRRWAEAALAPIRHPWIRASDLARRLGMHPGSVRQTAHQHGITVVHRYDPKSRARVAVIHLIEWEDTFGPVDRIRARRLPELPEGYVLVTDVARREGVSRQSVLIWARSRRARVVYVDAPGVPRKAAIPETTARLYARMRARRRRHREEAGRAA